jgi:UTP--glucose-1-phosphate uridylyltransferase
MSNVIKKAVILTNEDDSGFFPLARSIPKELLPIGETPFIQRLVDEVVECKIEEVVLISSTEKKGIIAYFQDLGKISEEYSDFKERYQDVSFLNVIQKKGTGSGYAIFKAKEKIEEEPFAVLFPNNIFLGKRSSIEQISAVYRTSKKQVLALKEVSDEDVSSSYIVKTEKIANRFYKIKKIIKNPQKEEVESRLALAGRYILTPTIFEHLKNSGAKTTIIDVINDVIASGKTVYGHQCEGKWFKMENKEDYLLAQKNFLNN